MGEMRQITIDIDTAEEIARAVSIGDFVDEAQVVAEAIALWRDARRSDLRTLLDEALDSEARSSGNFDAGAIKRRGRERLGLPM